MAERTFRRRRGGLINLVYLEIDDPAAAELRAALAKKRFDAAEQTIARQRDPNERMYYLEAAADWSGPAPFLREWAASGSMNGRLAAAIYDLKHAWDHSPWTRGPKDYQRFLAEVRVAKDALMAIAKASPQDATFFYWMIWAARALRDAKLARQLYDEAVRRDPMVLANYAAGLWTESPHWFGSREAMLAHARRAAGSAPPGVGADMLIVEAHWIAAGETRSPYWQKPEVRTDVLAAEARNRASPATGINLERSHQWFAYGLWAVGELALARERFAAMGGAPNELPWHGSRFGMGFLFDEFGKARKASMRA